MVENIGYPSGEKQIIDGCYLRKVSFWKYKSIFLYNKSIYQCYKI